MPALDGPISRRLRKLLSSGAIDNSAIHPGRPADTPPPKKGKKLPKGVSGESMGTRGKKK